MKIKFPEFLFKNIFSVLAVCLLNSCFDIIIKHSALKRHLRLHTYRTHKSPGNIMEINKIDPQILVISGKCTHMFNNIRYNILGCISLAYILIQESIDSTVIPAYRSYRIIASYFSRNISFIMKIFSKDFLILHKINEIFLIQIHML